MKEITLSKIVRIHENKDGYCYAVYDCDKLIGFIVYIMQDTCLYVYLLAVDSKFRGKGYGTSILNELIESNSDATILLDVEYPDKCTPNYE